MRQMFGLLILGLTAAMVQAHALFLVPAEGDATKVLVIFGDELAPDVNMKDTAWKRFDGLKLSARDGAGKTTDVKYTKEKGHLLATVPVGSRVVFGDVELPLVGKGTAVPKLTKYYVKAIVGAIPSDGGTISDKTELEIIPKADAGKIQFQVMASGKPVPGTTVMVMTPGKKGETEVKTGDQGWTTSFADSGRYAATCRKSETTSGARDGKKFEGFSFTATLVVDMK